MHASIYHYSSRVEVLTNTGLNKIMSDFLLVCKLLSKQADDHTGKLKVKTEVTLHVFTLEI